jgi:hypothetical protein
MHDVWLAVVDDVKRTDPADLGTTSLVSVESQQAHLVPAAHALAAQL